MKIIEMLEQTLKIVSSGIAADAGVKAIIGNWLKDNAPFHAIRLNDIEHLLLMMKEADFPHVYGENSTFYFCAYYFHDDRCPVGRNYFVSATDLLAISKLYQYFSENGLELPIIPPPKLSALIKEEGYQQRIQEFRARQERETTLFSGLFEGRRKAMMVDESIFLNSPGCLVCGSTDFFTMTSTLSAHSGFMLGFNLCQKHMDLAGNENSLIEYLTKVFKQPLPYQIVPLNIKQHLQWVLYWLPAELGSKVEKVHENTITLIRPSGLKGIFRLDSPTNYAYMILSPKGKEIARIDSADHHPIDYGPDHIHKDLTKRKHQVESSFTTGSPLIDAKKILSLILEKEAELEVSI